MADTKILQIILDRLTSLEQVVTKGFKDVNERFDKTDARIDRLGMDLAGLADDAPTRDDKLQKQTASV